MIRKNIWIEYDEEVDVAFINLTGRELNDGESKRQESVETDVLGEIIIDIDENGEAIGIEILNALRASNSVW